jgi:LCP family protein required for cell wall assembly
MKVDFLNGPQEAKARRMTVTIAAVFTLFVGLIAAVGAGASYRSAARGTSVFGEVTNLPVIADIRKLVLGDEIHAQDPTSTPDGRMNIMLFGIGGAGHDGSQLTDTIILASIDLNDHRVGLLSIPRDMAYPLGGTRFQKINAVNAYAEQDHPGQGAMIAATAIGKLLGVRMDHVVKIDFRGFEKFIDALGGVDINVERSFVDEEYPTDDEQWQTVSFKKGPQHMNGAQALIFARSRHGSNGEAGDFARAKRQQLVIQAVRDKLLSLGVLANPAKLSELWSVVSNHVQTDISPWDALKLAPLAAQVDRNKIVSRILSNAEGGELIDANVEGSGYMLFPKKPDWSEIRAIAASPFETKEESEARERPTETVRVEVKNGTVRTGFAAQVADTLKQKGYVVTATGNAAQKGYERSVIFDLTGGKKPEELARLKKILDANVSSVLPAWLTGSTSTRVVYSEGLKAEPINATSSEFLIILGESSLGLIQE